MSKDRKPLNPHISKSHLAPTLQIPRTQQNLNRQYGFCLWRKMAKPKAPTLNRIMQDTKAYSILQVFLIVASKLLNSNQQLFRLLP